MTRHSNRNKNDQRCMHMVYESCLTFIELIIRRVRHSVGRRQVNFRIRRPQMIKAFRQRAPYAGSLAYQHLQIDKNIIAMRTNP